MRRVSDTALVPGEATARAETVAGLCNLHWLSVGKSLGSNP